VFAASVVAAPLLLIVFCATPWRWAGIALLFVIGIAESGFATMQSTLVLLSAREDRRGGTMGILSACIGTQPVGTLALGLLASGMGVALAMALNNALALALIAPVALSLWRPRAGRGGGTGAGAS
jgi:hypothetical protein